MSSSPIGAAFRTVAKNPALVISEIAWRWTFGMTVCLLLVFTFFTYLQSLTVTNVDLILLKSRVPPLMAQAMGHILEGSGSRLLRASAVLLPTFAVLWVAAASLGRWASLRALVDVRGRLQTVVALHFLRAAAGLAAWIGYLGALLFAGVLASRGYEDRPGLFLLVFLACVVVIGFFHGRVRWFLSLATIVAAKEGDGAFAAISAGFDAYARRRNAFISAGVAIGGMRFAAVVLATVASLLPMVGLDAVRWKTAVVALAIITLAYLLAADILHIVRLAAYVEILRDEPQPLPVTAPAPQPALPSSADLQPTSEPSS